MTYSSTTHLFEDERNIFMKNENGSTMSINNDFNKYDIFTRDSISDDPRQNHLIIGKI